MNGALVPLRIVVVDDEPGIRQMLQVGLSQSGYTVTETGHGVGALEAVRRNEADLILLDLGLPDFDGLEIIKRIRYAQSNVPIIVLSQRGSEAAKVTALDLGADDFVTKPFGLEELLARVRVLHRQRVQPANDQSVIVVGAIKINIVHRTVSVRGADAHLSPREYALLQLLATHAGKVLTHQFILLRVWGSETDVQYLRIYIRALRRKIELEPDRPAILLTEPGVGYKMSVPDPTASASAHPAEPSGNTLMR